MYVKGVAAKGRKKSGWSLINVGIRREITKTREIVLLEKSKRAAT